MKGYQLFHILIVLCFFTISCSSDDGGGNNGWITITGPSDSTSYTAENIDTVSVSGNMFQSPSGGTVSGTECGCSNIAICFPPICRDYSFFRFALTVTVTNQTTGFSIEANLSEPDFWVAEIPVVYGDNLIEAYVEDVNGINSREHILIDVEDTIPPTILSRSPENNANNIATTTYITATFSESMEPSSITPSNISLSINWSEIEKSITFDNDTNQLVIIPKEPLLYNTSYTVKINTDITDINGTGIIEDTWFFSTIPMATTPSVKTEDATDVGESSATLWGSVSPNYADTHAWFEWGAGSNLSIFSTTEKVAIPPLSGNTKLSSKISLNPSVDYYYRMVASNSAGTTYGDIQSFFTLAPPTVITSPPLVLSPYHVKLSGAVNPNGYVAESSFKISSDPILWRVKSSSPLVQLGNGRNFIDVDHEFDQLSSGTKYYFRLDASYPLGAVTGDMLSFTTPYSTASCWAKSYHPYQTSGITLLIEEIVSLDQTLDNGFIFIERELWHEDGTGGARDTRVIKTNSDGGVEWAHTYTGRPLSIIRQINTGGYIVSGYITVHEYGFYNRKLWVVELDQNGDIVWEKIYGDTNTSIATSYEPTDIEIMPDGYIVSGAYRDLSAWLMKLDKEGNLIWSHGYYSGRSNDVEQVPEGFVMARTTINNSADWNMQALMLGKDGSVEWANDYGTPDKDIAKAIAVSAGTIAIVGTVIYADDASDIRVIGINTSGDITWQHTFDGGYNDSASSIRATSDGGFIIGSNTDINESDKGVVLLKLSNSGVLEWQKLYPDKIISNDQDALRPVSGGDYIIGVRSIPSQVNSIELIKTDSSGSCSPLDSSSSMVPTVSQLTITPDTVSSSSSPTEESAVNNSAIDRYVEIEQIYP